MGDPINILKKRGYIRRLLDNCLIKPAGIMLILLQKNTMQVLKNEVYSLQIY